MKKILIVDDSATARALFKAILAKESDYEIYEAEDHVSALQTAKSIKPDICVMDYNMPEHTGMEIAKAIIDAGIKTKFVLMTANTQKSVLEEAEILGFVGTIEKPISHERVMNILGEL